MSQLSDYQRMVEQPNIDRLTAKFQQQHAARYAAEARVRVLEEALAKIDAAAARSAAMIDADYKAAGYAEIYTLARAALAHGSGK